MRSLGGRPGRPETVCTLSLSLPVSPSFARFGSGCPEGVALQIAAHRCGSFVPQTQMADAVPGQLAPAGTFSRSDADAPMHVCDGLATDTACHADEVTAARSRDSLVRFRSCVSPQKSNYQTVFRNTNRYHLPYSNVTLSLYDVPLRKSCVCTHVRVRVCMCASTCLNL